MLIQSIRLLLIEDNPGDARLIREMLIDAKGVTFDLKWADRLAMGLELLSQNMFDVLLVDLSLPDSSGLETLVRVHSQFPVVPIVVLTGYDDETTGIKAVQEGAQDYLIKGQVDANLLARSLRYAIERKRIERELNENRFSLEWERAKLRAILDGMGEGLIYHEAFESKYVNQALCEMTGFSPYEMTGIGYLDLIRGKQYTANDLAAIYAEVHDTIIAHGHWQGELRLHRKDGTEFDAALTCSSVAHMGGKMAGAVTIIRDISKEKALEAQKSRFVANASHELRTPITNLKTTTYLMRRQPDHINEHLDTLDIVTDRMRSLVEDLLDVSRFERGVIPLRREVVPLQDILNEVARLQRPEAERKNISLLCEWPETALPVYADPKRMVQVFTNLVINAINYTPENQWIRVAAVLDKDEHILVTVTDSGIGIPPEALSRVFQPFFRVNEGGVVGTGLGLTITKEIVERHGGHIHVESTVGKGCTFIVRIPTSLPVTVLAER